MKYSIVAFRIVFLIWISVTKCATDYAKIQGPLPNISLAGILDYVKPYFKSLQLGPATTVYKKSFDRTSNIGQAIDTKIKDLEQFFQDGDDIIPKDTIFKRDEDTTIIEFVPKSQTNGKTVRNKEKDSETYRSDIRKYKTMRNKIKLALEKEKVAPKTKKMVTKTLDELIAKLLSSRCNWNESITNVKSYLDNNTINTTYCYIGNIKISADECNAIIKNLTSPDLQLDDKQLYDNVDNTMNTSNIIEKIIQVIKASAKFHNDSQTVTNRYKLRCEVIDQQKMKGKTGLRRNVICENFRLCSAELKQFLADFYNSLNDTAVSAFRNYAAMYVRDVNTDDSEEKAAVAATITNASDFVEQRVSKVFKKQLSKIKLDDNKNIERNVEALKAYVSKTVIHIKNKIKKHIESDLQNLRARLILGIKDDININLDVDLGNIESHYLENICTLFITCNGEIAGSLRKGSPINESESNSVYVRVQVLLDDKLTDTLEKRGLKSLRDSSIGNTIDTTNQKAHKEKNGYSKVTRTTVRMTATKVISSTTEKTESSDTDNRIII